MRCCERELNCPWRREKTARRLWKNPQISYKHASALKKVEKKKKKKKDKITRKTCQLCQPP
jgi:hypothetical protein